ncbi:MAG TPA: glycosyltransferase [Terriglobales bacterium]|nr:glycosyltransferase [Terriglobales bacterium]
MPPVPAPRLLQVIDNAFPPCPRGAVLYTQEVANALGGAVFSLAPPPPEASPATLAWPGREVFYPRPDESMLSAWHRALDEVLPGAVFVQHLGSSSPVLLFDLRERGIPYAVFLHDYTPLCPVHRLWHRRQERCSGPGRTGWKCAWCVSGSRRRWPELPLRTLLYRHRPLDWRTALVRAEVLVAASRYLREFWIEEGAPPERIAVIPPLLAAAPAPPADTAPRSLPRLLYAGGCGQDEGIEILAGALDLLREPVQLEAIGCLNAPQRQALRAAITARHALVFPGVVPPSAMPARLAACDAVALPARWEAASARLALEAQRVGIPVVATAVGGLTERIIHGVNGFLAAPDDPHAFAAALREAFLREPPAWAGERVRQEAADQAAASLGQLHRLLQLLASGALEPDPALALEHGAWLAQAARAHAVSLPEAAQRLVSALRQGDAESTSPASSLDSDCAVRAQSVTRQRQVDLNHATAFFRACGCQRIAHWPDSLPPTADAVACFQTWALQTVASRDLPDGIFVQFLPPEGLDPAWLRHRFPQARALVNLATPEVETTAWAEGGD